MIKEINRLGNSRTYAYDANNNLVSETAFDGSTTHFTYDNLGRLTSQAFADSTGKSFTYDPAGNILEAANETVTLKYTYDKLNRLTNLTDTALAESIHYTYDAAGNRTAIEWLDGKRKIHYTYGKLNELLKVTDSEGQATRYEYDSLGREIRKRMPNDIVTDTTYDAAGRIIAIRNYKDNRRGKDESLASYGYLYNAAGARIYQVNESGEITAYN